VRSIPSALRKERCAGSDLAERHPNDEPEHLSRVRRCADRVGSRSSPVRVGRVISRGPLTGVPLRGGAGVGRSGPPGTPPRLPRVSGVTYRAFDDPMGGRGDSWAKCSAHRERDKVVIDLVRAWPPATGVHDIAKESAEIGKRYGCKSTVGDNYAGEWPKEAFAEHGVADERCELAKSDLYLAAIPLMSSKRVELLDNDRRGKEFRRL